MIQSNLSWNSRIDYICKKASKRLDILNSVSHKLSRKSLETMYFSYVRTQRAKDVKKRQVSMLKQH